MESEEELDYMSQDIIEKAKEFDIEFKIQKETLKLKKETFNQESSDEEEEVNIFYLSKYRNMRIIGLMIF